MGFKNCVFFGVLCLHIWLFCVAGNTFILSLFTSMLLALVVILAQDSTSLKYILYTLQGLRGLMLFFIGLSLCQNTQHSKEVKS